MARHLQTRYGASVQVKYHDLADPAEREKFPQVLANIRAQGWPMPVVIIDGEVRFQGFVSFWDIAEAIEARRSA